MNSQTFEVGEVAIYVPGEKFAGHGCEVTIQSGLFLSSCVDYTTGHTGELMVHLIHGAELPIAPTGSWAAAPADLRKKHPPQDWRQLCHLIDLPVMRPKEIA